MDISQTIAEMKKDPDFAKNTGMILIHNGIVRAWSLKNRSTVTELEVISDHERIELLRSEYEKKPGIYRIVIQARSGNLKPGDDLLFIIVAGDIRKNVKPVMSELLDRIKTECVQKKERHLSN
ncbi:MAG: molybdenum cofactor biosynthesis protein MoaE [Deltaproteobacteria bacterium]|nr:molybdenum cofactor biosynthesis protein MoaE [Deltaproteobacteria bacterium]MBW1914644.1 molybdenum cofactor biosynthesis protein MoaE [Deltaproteobacteria bacterium]